MKRGWCLFLIAPATVWAEWKDVRVGLKAEAVVQAVGEPLIRSRSRGGLYETWTFDHGGSVVFVRDRVSYCQEPRTRTGAKGEARPTPRPAR